MVKKAKKKGDVFYAVVFFKNSMCKDLTPVRSAQINSYFSTEAPV